MTQVAEDIYFVLEGYRKQVNLALKEAIPCLGGPSRLREACEYALLNGGKRFRPALVLLFAKALGNQGDVMQSALGVEFFHTASLVADDLPCMDDDDERREKPSTHKIYGEASALLVSYALIAAGYEKLALNARIIRESNVSYSKKSDRICVLALENATYNTGLLGATGGQFLDIHPPDLSEETLRKVIHQKTSSLFEISFVLGWLYGGGDPEKLRLVKRAASHFGMAFQIADDLGDMEQDAHNKRDVNMANVFGREAAVQMFHVEHDGYHDVIERLGVETNELKALMGLLVKKV